MDDILQRMLAIDRQAEEIIKEAGRKAEQINTAGRLRINTLNAEAQKSLQEEARRLETGRIQVVEQQCQEKVAAAEKEFSLRGRGFLAGVDARRRDLLGMLAFPR